MIALQCSPLPQLGSAKLELVYCSGCCSELFVDYAYLLRHYRESAHKAGNDMKNLVVVLAALVFFAEVLVGVGN